MRLVVDLTLPTEVRLIARTRRIFRDYMEEMGVDQEDAHDVVLALDEACTNVIRHAFPDGEECFRLQAQLSDGEVVVVVEDDGVGLPSEDIVIAPRPADPEATTGRGMQIIRELMTSVEVETAPQRQGTRLEMRKDLRPAGFSAAG